jgi:Na+-translocating ferredoxin:NAD+ oxidoreductase RnfD subunit
MNSRTLTLGATSYPVTLPNIRDSRLHVAAVVVTVHVLGQVTLDFHVSVPQILAAILTCAVMEVAITFRRTRSFVWPASAMLTGSGIGLILRVPSTPVGDHWSTHHWYVFAGVAGGSLATKYLIRYRGSHVFNPSNVGLVVAFVLLGSSRVEPLDFWWAPLDAGMVVAYVVIIGGGVLITHRLGLLGSALTFWVWFAAGIGVLAASGHCMIARWAFDPVCGFDYWRSIVTSPELMIFMLFMITDPKTLPAGRVGRSVFGLLVAVLAALLLAPQTSEFWSKVSLLGALVVLCPFRYVLDRILPAAGSPDDDVRQFVTRLVTGRRAGAAPRRVAAHLALSLVVVVGLGAGVVAAGAPARGVVVPSAHDVLGRALDDIDPATLPTITVDQGVLDWNHEVSGRGAQEIVLTLVENLHVETRALLARDATMLEAVDHGDRLDELQARLRGAGAGDPIVVEQYRIDDVHITLVVPFGAQTGLSLGLESTGTVTTETYDAAGTVVSRSSAPFAQSFVLGRPFGTRWINVAVLPLAENG